MKRIKHLVFAKDVYTLALLQKASHQFHDQFSMTAYEEGELVKCDIFFNSEIEKEIQCLLIEHFLKEIIRHSLQSK